MNSPCERQISDFATINRFTYKEGGSVKYLDTGNITSGVIDEIQSYDSLADAPSRARRKVVCGDIVYSTVRPNQKHYGYVSKEMENLVVSTGFAVISTNDDAVNSKYVYYYLSQDDVTNYLQSIAEQSTSAYPSITSDDIGELTIPLPDRAIQDKIVNIIDSICDLIITNSSINDNLEALCQTKYELLINELMFDYEEGQLSDYGEIVGGSTPSKAVSDYYTESGIAWLTPKDLSNNKSKFIKKGSIDITKDGLDNSSARVMPRGTILYTSRAPIGYIAIAKNDITTNQGFKSVIPKDGRYRSFIYYYLKNNYELIYGLASGSTFMEISGSAMKAVPIPLISNDKAESFEAYCSPIFNYQEQIESEIMRLTQLRNYLLPKLMSGEIDVSTLEIPN